MHSVQRTQARTAVRPLAVLMSYSLARRLSLTSASPLYLFSGHELPANLDEEIAWQQSRNTFVER
jgi:hypothetical protein